ncbi:MAG: tRNA (adenosine(37)-N6)-threonylcarbamoyltransferase complex dimerization subunit type 1 TsaB [Moorea sp. SIOASIH]|uniref:tRNA (Adenosine(37)-N6)-threonylcarbamoyltransferase complex dimerization subunit type 1 TsaB n=1 Tax=Moorena bouillonii PNG TaxID=568701 RepID=A0A1U7N099_9CYAN|nr:MULTISPECIES: tRNA (adenosine(37)-N6)-threonylcarbamoyltransferase complex dimerization subunit type 1 TsaB [Moorena]NEO34864.1 tRNA (adenosine(37)-N6)-threonylcarbamoyltransferase complex dimerization subunit type 1 TsaB [Moorena sp. SIOASIH]NEO89517.1 tRNA (adenosine(37)-N6)-threonylcarbamoyltransferase complex dimerization subunit type 1 TsaB [Moorena sp. SIO3G5]OLT59378.1 tRNA (adenosine(37)-N6)-threonylcarbamoyltransferase complex dimerization subunit type 1 TsaB [Moorena bouillonii PNG]
MPILEPNKYALALHTTSPQLGLVISNFARDTRCQTWDLGRELSGQLHQHLTEFLNSQTWENLEFIAVAIGPGSFTSTRIGIVTARTLAQQLHIPLFGISTLAAIAWLGQEGKEGEEGAMYQDNSGSALSTQHSAISTQYSAHALRARYANSTQIAIQMPAQRGQLYTAIYQPSIAGLGLRKILPDAVMTSDQWKQVLDTLETPIRLLKAPANLGSYAKGVLELAYLDWQQGKRPNWSEVLPFYGQHPV